MRPGEFISSECADCGSPCESARICGACDRSNLEAENDNLRAKLASTEKERDAALANYVDLVRHLCNDCERDLRDRDRDEREGRGK